MDREVIGGLERGVHIWTIEPDWTIKHSTTKPIGPNSQINNLNLGSLSRSDLVLLVKLDHENPNFWGELPKNFEVSPTYIPEN